MTAYTLFGQTGGATPAANTGNVTLGCEFEVASSVSLTGIWWNSPASAVALPSACAIYDQAAGTQASGTLDSSPSWSGAAGSGWVKCSYGGAVTLISGKKYYVCVYNGSGTLWYASTTAYFTTGAGASGITNGPLSAPNNSSSAAGQNVAASGPGSISFPTINEAGKCYFVDVEVTVSSVSPAGLLMAAGIV